MPDLSILAQQLAIWAVPVLLAVTVHEAAHGYAARFFGDDTAARAGRLSLNPIRHIDPVGTIAVPAIMLTLSSFLFGWAKPVPVNFGALRSPRRDMALVAAAGPAANLVMAILWAAAMGVDVRFNPPTNDWSLFQYICMAGVGINTILMVLNLLPIPPLDGGRILMSLLPPEWAAKLARVEVWGLMIVVVLLVSGVLTRVIHFPMSFVEGGLYQLFGITALIS